FTPGLVVMDQAGAPRHDFNDFVFLAEEVAGRFDTMAPKVVQRSAPRLFHIPEVRTVGPSMGLPRTHPKHATHSAALNHLPGPDHSRRKDFGFRISMHCA